MGARPVADREAIILSPTSAGGCPLPERGRMPPPSQHALRASSRPVCTSSMIIAGMISTLAFRIQKGSATTGIWDGSLGRREAPRRVSHGDAVPTPPADRKAALRISLLDPNGHVSPAVSKDSRASKHKRSSVDVVDQTAGAGVPGSRQQL